VVRDPDNAARRRPVLGRTSWSTLVVPDLTKIDTVSRVVSGHPVDLELRSSGVAGGARIALRSGAHQAVRWPMGGNHDR
jgi:hypothetical protein